ncbi:MAG: protocatechuate 3,4-dioxygenase subunit beta, partial [Ferrovibrio sp.]
MSDLIGYKRPAAGTQPNYLHPPYQSSIKRAPNKPLIKMPQTLTELTGPVYGHERVGPLDNDLTKQHAGEPLG